MSRRSGFRIRPRAWSFMAVAMGVLFAGAALAAAFAPFVYAELMPRLQPHVIVDPAPAKIAKGRMFDDYFVVSGARHLRGCDRPHPSHRRVAGARSPRTRRSTATTWPSAGRPGARQPAR